MTTRVFITGMGAVFCNGQDVPSFWESLYKQRSGIKSGFSTGNLVRFAGLIGNEGEESFTRIKKNKTPRHISFCAQAFAEAATSLKKTELNSCGIYLGCDMGCTDELFLNTLKLPIYSPNENNEYKMNMELIFNNTTSEASLSLELKDCKKLWEDTSPSHLLQLLRKNLGVPGRGRIFNSLCTSAMQACGHGFESLLGKRESVAFCGGTEAFSYQQVCSFLNLSAYSKAERPENACCPFGKNRSGVVLGEGAGMLLMETDSHIQKSGTKPLCEILSYSTNNNACHMTRPNIDGRGFHDCMNTCLEKAGLTPADIDLIVAHGTGTPHNDYAEARAINKLFPGPQQPWVQSIKSYIGHTLSTAGVANIIAGVLQMQHNFVIPTLYLKNIDPMCVMKHPPASGKKAEVKNVLINSSSFGGINASMIIQACQ